MQQIFHYLISITKAEACLHFERNCCAKFKSLSIEFKNLRQFRTPTTRITNDSLQFIVSVLYSFQLAYQQKKFAVQSTNDQLEGLLFYKSIEGVFLQTTWHFFKYTAQPASLDNSKLPLM